MSFPVYILYSFCIADDFDFSKAAVPIPGNGGEFFQNNNTNKKDKAELPSFFADQTEEPFEESLLEDGLEVNKTHLLPSYTYCC